MYMNTPMEQHRAGKRMPKKNQKVFVLDTNVILHDSSCIYQFQEHDVVVPITVIEELDQFKKGNTILNFHAREFVRALDALGGDQIFDEGFKIGPESGHIRIRLEHDFHPDIKLNFPNVKPDHQILNTAYLLAKEKPGRAVILVSKDVNLRMKAKSMGLRAQDYIKDHVKDPGTLYKGSRIIENADDALLDSLLAASAEIEAAQLVVEEALVPNEFLILRNLKRSVLATFDARRQVIARIDTGPCYGIYPRNAQQIFALNALTNPDISLVSVSGKAGTGKTLLALAAALEKKRAYRQIYVARPVVPLSNKDIGYLPGDIQSKIAPYMQPLHDNLNVIQGQFSETDKQHASIKSLLEQDKLIVEPLAYIRGRSLVKTYFIIDEAQNLTPHEVKTIITRAGVGTKIVLTGDIMQIDHPYLDSQSNGLTYLIPKMHGQNIYAHVHLEKSERSELAELASDLL